MKKIILLAFSVLIIAAKMQAQISEHFSKQITALITTSIDKIKGELTDQGSGVATHNSLLKLDEFKVSYTTSGLGNILRADYVKPGTMEVMDNIHYSFLETSYTCKDSKDYPQMLKGLLNSDVKRKIELIETDLKNRSTKKMLVVEMDKENNIIIKFLNK